MKAKYGLRAALFMAEQPDRYWQARDIATGADVPLAFLENILRELRGRDLISTRRGAAGGYRLNHPDTLSAGAVVRALDGMLAPIRCASRLQYRACDDCRDPATCNIRHLMLRVRDEISAVLDQQHLTDMLNSPLLDDDDNSKGASYA